MSKKNKKVKIGAIALIGSLFLVMAYSIISQGTIMQVESSTNPIGYYQVKYELPDQTPVSDVDIDIYIVNATEIIRTLHIVNGMFTDSSQNVSDVYYSHSQSHAVLYKAGFKTDCAPIECYAGDVGVMNTLVVRRMAYYSEMAVQVQIGEVIDGSPIEYNNFDTDYSIIEGHNYSIYLSYRNLLNTFLEGSPVVIGAMVILPPLIVELFYPLTYTLNVTNYECLSFTINSTMRDLHTQKSVFDVTNFSYSGVDYSIIALSPAVYPSFIENEFRFTATETCIIQYSLLDGAIDQVFDWNYDFAKYGGGFD
jgi:hypothetical protein